MDVAAKKKKTAVIAIRLEEKDREALEREAKEELLELTTYVRRLLLTDPRRQKNKKEK